MLIVFHCWSQGVDTQGMDWSTLQRWKDVLVALAWSASDATRLVLHECGVRVVLGVAWTWAHTLDVALRGLYFHGPEIPGLGLFWRGMRPVDICTALTKGVNSDFWRAPDGGPNAQCVSELERHYVSFLFGVGLCVAVLLALLCYKEYENARLRAHVTRDMTTAMASFATLLQQRKVAFHDGVDPEQAPVNEHRATRLARLARLQDSLPTPQLRRTHALATSSRDASRQNHSKSRSRSRHALLPSASSSSAELESAESPGSVSSMSPGTRRKREVAQLIASTFSEVLSDSLNITHGVLTRGMRHAHALVNGMGMPTAPPLSTTHATHSLLDDAEPQAPVNVNASPSASFVLLGKESAEKDPRVELGPASPSPFR